MFLSSVGYPALQSPCLQIAHLPNLPLPHPTLVCPLVKVNCYLALKLLLCFDVLQDPNLVWDEIQTNWDPVKAQSL